MPTKKYVLGFIFCNFQQVVLTKKEHPDWQKGKYNGIGGHVEEGETLSDAMEREGREEVGRDFNWIYNGIVKSKEDSEGNTSWMMGVYSAFPRESPEEWLPDENDVGEKLELVSIEWLGSLRMSHGKIIDNLRFLVPLAEYGNTNFIITEK